jgi:hypothetical protein
VEKSVTNFFFLFFRKKKKLVAGNKKTEVDGEDISGLAGFYTFFFFLLR